MNGNDSAKSLGPDRAGSLWVACIVLTLVTGAVLPAFLWVGHRHHGGTGMAAAGVAAGVCWGGAMVALVVGGLFRHSKHAVSGVLAGMLFRMGVPLMAGAALDWQGGPLAEAGVFGMILVYYFVTLAAETLLAVRLVSPRSKTSGIGA